MLEIIKDIFSKWACKHEWKLVKEQYCMFQYHYVYICKKCGKVKHIKIGG
mgnify:CR=1 FL=1